MSSQGCRLPSGLCRGDAFRYAPSRKRNVLALTLLLFLGRAARFRVTGASTALNTHFLPAFSLLRNGSQRAKARPPHALRAMVYS